MMQVISNMHNDVAGNGKSKGDKFPITHNWKYLLNAFSQRMPNQYDNYNNTAEEWIYKWNKFVMQMHSVCFSILVFVV